LGTTLKVDRNSPLTHHELVMSTRQIPVHKALAIIKRARPQVEPNYGFIKELHAFEACRYSVSSTDATYRTWKRKHRQDVTSFLNSVSDTTVIVPEKLSLSSDFPADPERAANLVSYLGLTHCISLSPSATFPSNIGLTHNHIEIPQTNKASLLLALPAICKNIQDVLDNRGRILVHCLTESTAAIIACAYLMWSRQSSYKQAYRTLHDGISRCHCRLDTFLMIYPALPLFNPTDNFTKLLELYAACNCSPSSDHPALQDWLGIGYQSSSATPSQLSGSVAISSSPTRRAPGMVLPTPLPKQLSKAGGQANHSLSSLRPVTLDG
jgi:dual specificity phosphatase 12